MTNPEMKSPIDLPSGITLYPSQDKAIDQVLNDLMQKSPAEFILLAEASGQVLSAMGERTTAVSGIAQRTGCRRPGGQPGDRPPHRPIPELSTDPAGRAADEYLHYRGRGAYGAVRKGQQGSAARLGAPAHSRN